MKLFAWTALCLFAVVPLCAAGPRAPDDPKLNAPLSGLARLRPAVHDSMPGWQTGHLPRWQAHLGGRTYHLVFDGKKELEQLVESNRGVWWWKVSGRAERRNYALRRQPARPGEPVFQDLRLVVLDVLVVESLEPTLLEARRIDQPVRVTVQAEIQWFGNSYSRLENGAIVGTLKGCPWEGCYIVHEGRRVRVLGLPGDVVEQQGYRGQTLVLVGRVEQRADGPGVPPDVLIVESFRRL